MRQSYDAIITFWTTSTLHRTHFTNLRLLPLNIKELSVLKCTKCQLRTRIENYPFSFALQK